MRPAGGRHEGPVSLDPLVQGLQPPLLFASSALYPVSVMPGRLRALSRVNPLTYEVDGLREMLIGSPSHVGLDFLVLVAAVVVGVATASSLVSRLAR